MKKKKEPMARINTRILPSQNEFIKAESKKLGIGEGELYRLIIQFYQDNHK